LLAGLLAALSLHRTPPGGTAKAARSPTGFASPSAAAKLGIAEHPPSILGSRRSRGNTGKLQNYIGGLE